MILSPKPVRILGPLVLLILLNACGGLRTEPAVSEIMPGSHPGLTRLEVGIFGEGTEITAAGQLLMDQSEGMLEVTDGESHNDSVMVVNVHGYASRGYEWVTGLKHLAQYYGSVFFFRYDWERCPEDVASELSAEILRLYKAGRFKKLIIFGHSYGGMVVTFTASKLGRTDAEIHIIAAPLSGFPQLLDACDKLNYDHEDKLIYPEWSKGIRLIQHKTVHAQDGAFRDLASDPQDVDLPFSQVIDLPPTMDGHRLGHNWSVTWVLDKHVGKPHRL